MKRRPDPLIKTQPWKVNAVFQPLESMLGRLEREGTVDTYGMHIVFREISNGRWYDAVAALRGVIEFHQIAQSRYGIPADVAGLIRMANKLSVGSPIFEADLETVRANLRTCRQQAMRLRVSQAADIVKTIQISIQLENQGIKEAA